jgi:hypothetical protein
MSNVHQLSIVKPHDVVRINKDVAHERHLVALFDHVVWDGLVLKVVVRGEGGRGVVTVGRREECLVDV